MTAQRELTPEVITAIKANVQRLNINQWALKLGCSYRTVQKIVNEETYKDVGVLDPDWYERRRPQRRGPAPRTHGTAPRVDTHHAIRASVRRDFNYVVSGIADRYGITTDDVLKLSSVKTVKYERDGNRNKLTTAQVAAIRRDFDAGYTYAQIAQTYGISAPTISKVCGRGAHDASTYVPKDHDPDFTPEVTQEVTDEIEPDFGDAELPEGTG